MKEILEVLDHKEREGLLLTMVSVPMPGVMNKLMLWNPLKNYLLCVRRSRSMRRLARYGRESVLGCKLVLFESYFVMRNSRKKRKETSLNAVGATT